MKNSAFIISACIVFFISIFGFLYPLEMQVMMNEILHKVNDGFGWFYVLSTAIFIGFCFFLGFGPFRHMKLGNPDEKPEYSYYTWIGMLFAAGMGVGLVFWGVAEPISHYYAPPPGVEAQSQQSAELGILYGVFHWGLHPWAVYAVVALGLAFAKFRKNLPGLISSAFFPLFGRKVFGPLGKTIDITAIVCTTVGIATSFGLSTLQISGGLEQLTSLDNTPLLQISIIGFITIIFITSVISGINQGMRYLSIINLTIACFLLFMVIILGPTLFIMEHFTKTLGSYISNFVTLSFFTTPYTDNLWIGNWTFFYWAWVISWSPFVGTFIARISRGRTLQEFILGVLFVPTLLTIVWFVAFGGTALFYEIKGVSNISSQVYTQPETGLFLMLNQLPFGSMLSILALFLICIFFITSANSATYVLGVFSSKGSLSPKNIVLVIWGVLISAIAAALLFSGGLQGLQALAIISALPFTFIILLMIVAVYKSLRREGIRKDQVEEKEEW